LTECAYLPDAAEDDAERQSGRLTVCWTFLGFLWPRGALCDGWSLDCSDGVTSAA
jgi:hypothetical protein